MRPTVRQFLEDGGARYAGPQGASPTSCLALQYLNKARSTLWNRKDWIGTVEYGCIQLTGNCFYLPWHLDTIRAAWAGSERASLFDEYYITIEDNILSDCCDLTCDFKVHKTGKRSPLPFTVVGEHKIGFTNIDNRDNGTIVTMRFMSGSSIETETITLDANKVSMTDNIAGKVLSISKGQTHGSVQVLVIGTDGSVQVAHTLAPQEDVPEYTEYRGYGNHCQAVVVKAKKRFVNFTEKDLDTVLDIKPEGLEFAMQAIVAKEKNSLEGDNLYVSKLLLAEGDLETEMKDRNISIGAIPAPAFEPKITFSER